MDDIKWLDIETAPLDGTKFIALTWKGVCRCHYTTVVWSDNVYDPSYKAFDNPDDCCWFEEPRDEPTHWMPMPSLPETDTKECNE